MKKKIALLIIILLVSCSPGSNAECLKGVCIDVEFKGRIQEWGAATAVITVQSDHDISGLVVGVFLLSGMKIIRPLSAPEGSEIIFQDDKLYNWQFNALADIEYTITAEVEIFPPPFPPMEEGDIATYDIQAMAHFPGVDILRKQHSIYLNYLGREVEPGKDYGAEAPAYEPKTTYTIMPGATDVIEPTPITPTPNPNITPTPTEVSYPAPVESLSSPTERGEPTAYP